jgi:hypothetical protein
MAALLAALAGKRDTPSQKNWLRGKFFLAWGAGKPYFPFDPARRKAGQSGDRVTPVRRFLL